MRYLPRFPTMLLLTTLLAVGLPDASLAAGTLVVTVPQGDYTLFLEYRDAKGALQTTPPVKASGSKAAIDLAPLGDRFSSPVIVALEEKTGNAGAKPVTLKPGAGAEATLTANDITAVSVLRVRAVGADGQPAASGSVTLTDSKKQVTTRPILPGEDGVAKFERVPFGRANVKVVFGDGASLAQDVDVTANHAPGAFSVDLAMAAPAGSAPANAPEASANAPAANAPGSAAVTPPDAAGAAAPANTPVAPAPQPAAPGTGGVGSIIALVILGGLVYGGYRALREKGGAIPDLLKRLGVQLPPDVEPAASAPSEPARPAPSVPEGSCPFCGQAKDPATGACACSVAATPGLGSAAAAPAGVAPRLVVVQGPELGLTVALTDAPAVIGRSAENPVPLPRDATVSRRHASVTREGDSYVLRDEGSSNGTFVNGLRVTEQVLRPGDEIQLGNTRIRFEV